MSSFPKYRSWSMSNWGHRILTGGLRACLRPVYRFAVHGAEWLPPHGPAVIVHNAVAWPDVVVLPLSTPRPVRCLVPTTRRRGHWHRMLGRIFGVILIEQEQGPEALLRGVDEARRALERGELVAVPADAPYQVGPVRVTLAWWIRQLLGGDTVSAASQRPVCSVPIIPAALDRVWGNLFREHRGGFRWKRPLRMPLPLTVVFDSPLSADTPVSELEQRIQLLHCQAFEKRKAQEWSLPRHFVRQACRHPFRVCVIDGLQKGLRLTYAQTLAGAVALRDLLEPVFGADEHKVGLLLPTSVGAVLANLAITLSGRIAVNLNYTASQEALASAVRQCQIRHVLTTRRLMERIPQDWASSVSLIYLEELRGQISRWRKLVAWLQCVLLPAWILERRLGLQQQSGTDPLITVIFSSGTTGDPKGVMLSHFNVLANIQSICQAIEPLPQDRILGVLPLFHSFGYTVTFWLPLVIGASAVYYPDPRQAKEIGDLCREHRCTLFVTTPTFLRLVHRRCERNHFRSIRLLITGAEKLPRSLAEAFAEKFGIWPLEGYGCTELSPVVSTNLPDERLGVWERMRHKLGTIGRPIPAVAVQLVDLDTGQPVSVGQMGMLRVYGPNVMLGYLGREKQTQEAIQEGWYVTGDLAELDEEGFLTIRDRLARFSKIGGEMVPHQRVEDEIQRILGTTELVCAVVGVPDERKGEKLVVVHRPWADGLTSQEILSRLKAKGLPNLWLPDTFLEVPELPVLATGKLDLRRLKALALEQLSTQQASP
ncbi:MAG: AMP-binding protein [Gemmatales bacterium]|nr:AMP-binding protein [Gemmatales bacterium]MDW8174103.1 AMP-binding protein [Gemmatales bacterium]